MSRLLVFFILFVASAKTVTVQVGNNTVHIKGFSPLRKSPKKFGKGTHGTPERKAGGAEKALGPNYLVYLSEATADMTFYKSDFELHNIEKLATTEYQKNRVDNLFLDHREKLLYWSYDGSTLVGRLNLSIVDEPKIKYLKGDESAITVGIGKSGKVYLYFPKTKQLLMYDFESGRLEKELNGLKNADVNMNCVDVDPRDRAQIFYEDCSGKNSFGRVFDVNKDKVDESYTQALIKCFDQWKISPDANQAYAVSNREIYLSPKEGEPFEEYYLADDEIVGFAAGNDVLFFTTKEPGKIFKVTKAPASAGAKHANYLKEFEVQGIVRAMVLHQ